MPSILESAPEQSEMEPIAIVGYSLKFPGEAIDAESFWNLMQDKRCAVTDTAKDRMNASAWHHPDSTRRGIFATQKACYLSEDVSLFDAPFFSLSANEASAMDPQQRHLLEVTYRALENAGIPIESVIGSRTSVHVGCFGNDYGQLRFKDVEETSDYDVFGVNVSMNANRLSWFFDFRGASMNIDTACSSSLVGMDMAFNGLIQGEADMAIVAGTNLILSPNTMVTLSNVNMLSPDGVSWSFDSRANGYGRGEGTGVTVLKRLKDAIRDGDTIRAVIRSTGCNQDGRTPAGIMQPSSTSQTDLIRDVYSKANLSMEPTRFFEAHGTGTPVGDPIETNALGSIFRQHRTHEDPLYVGSVKANIGHLEGASGIASVIKTVMILESGQILPNANLETISPRIDTDFLRIKFPQQLTPWPSKGLRRASVNSFGFGGTNAHVVIDDAYHYLKLHGLKGNHATKHDLEEEDHHSGRLTNGYINGYHHEEDVLHTNGYSNGYSNGHANDAALAHVNGYTNGVMHVQANSYTNGHCHEGDIPHTNGHAKNTAHVEVNGYTNGITHMQTNGYANGTSYAQVNGCSASTTHTLVNGVKNDHREKDHDGVQSPKLVTLSAYSKRTLEDVANQYAKFFTHNTPSGQGFDNYVSQLAYTLNQRRSRFTFKSFAVVKSKADLININRKLSTAIQPCATNAIAFVFTGQGAQYANMAKELVQYPVFKRSLANSEKCLRMMGCPWSLSAEIFTHSGFSRINSPEISQPATTAIQIALVDLLEYMNIRPKAVIGHSSGEIGAAYCQGSLSTYEAMHIAYRRGVCAAELISLQGDAGSMLAVGLGEDEARKYIDKIDIRAGDYPLQVACINSHKSVTLAGPTKYIDAVARELHDNSIFYRKLKVGIAYHTKCMEQVAEAYRASLNKLQFQEHIQPKAAMVSTVTGESVDAKHLRSAEYWVQNLVSCVQFPKALAGICHRADQKVIKKLDRSHKKRIAINILLEIGPSSALQGPINDFLRTLSWGNSTKYFSTVKRGDNPRQTFMETVGNLYCLGISADLQRLNEVGSMETRNKVLVNLPEYPFDHRTSYWRESRVSRRFRLHAQAKLDLLGKQVADFNELEACWRNHLRLTEMPWMSDHVINGATIYPAAGMMVMAIEAIYQLSDKQQNIAGFRLQDVTFSRAITIPESSEGIETKILIRQMKDSAGATCINHEFRLCSFEGDNWQENCRGFIGIEYEKPKDEVSIQDFALRESVDRQNKIIQECKLPFDKEQAYECLSQSGLRFGKTFRTNSSGFFNEKCQAHAIVDVFKWPDNENPQPHIIHPTTLDGILHLSAIGYTHGGQRVVATGIPTGLRSMWIARNGLNDCDAESVLASSWAQALQSRSQEFCGHALAKDSDRVLVRYEGLQFTIIGNNISSHEQDASEAKQISYGLEYYPSLDLLDHAALLQLCNHGIGTFETPIQYFEDLNFILFKFLWDSCQYTIGKRARILQPHLMRYKQWAYLQIDKFLLGKLELSHPSWVKQLNDQQGFLAKCDRVYNANDQGRAFVRAGFALSKILTGQLDPLDFLFQDDMMPRFYAEVNNNRICFAQWERYLQAYTKSNPVVKILEIGAGTGGTTERVLRSFRTSDGRTLYTSYDYTDISPAFFDQAQVKFQGHPRIHYRALNIEETPASQGFDIESYDIVIAANVLHATRNIAQTLRNVHSLLKPGGKLMMYEPTRPEIIRTNFLAGLMAGWWAGEEEQRYWDCVLTTPQWHDVLQSTGFTGIDLELQDYQDYACQEGSILISSTIQRNPLEDLRKSIVLVGDDESGEQDVTIQDLSLTIRRDYSNVTIEKCSLAELALRKDLADITAIFVQEIEEPLLSDISEKVFLQLQHVLMNCNKILWLGSTTNQRPEYSMTNGLFRTLRNEKAMRRIVSIAFEIKSSYRILSPRQLDHTITILQTLLDDSALDYEPEYVEINEQMSIPRIGERPDATDNLHQKSLAQVAQKMTIKEAGAVEMKIGTVGVLDTLHWVSDTQFGAPLKDTEIELEVRVVGMNFKDCLIALGRVPGDTLGQECAGFVTRAGSASGFSIGDRVVSFAPATFKTFARSSREFACTIPEGISFAEAAAVPAQYGTAWECVVELGRLRKGETILVHAGAGGTGQAAINLGLMIGAEVFATVGSPAKKEILMREYGIKEDHIFNSRNTSFAEGIKYMTQGRGVDVIINSLAGDALLATWSCIAPYGRFVEIGKKDILANSRLPMFIFNKNASFTHFDGSVWIHEKPGLAKESISNIFRLLQERKISTQKPLHIYNIADVESAFRAMQSGATAGKIVLEVDPEAQIDTLMDNTVDFSLDSNATYVIAGGLGGIGRTTARWMASRGAKYLALLGRSGVKTEAARELVAELESQGITVATPPCDVINSAQVLDVMQNISKTMPPVKGCIQGSMVLRDNRFEEISYNDWRAAVECKALGSWNLHKNLPSGLDFFVMLSSLSGVIGLSGQANYASGNSYLDALARYRVSNGQRAISFDLGVMIDDGLLVETEGFLDRVLSYRIMNPITRRQFLGMLDHFCDARRPLPKPDDCQILMGLNGVGSSDSHMAGLLIDKPIAKILALEGVEARSSFTSSSGEAAIDYRRLISNASNIAEASTAATQAIVSRLETTYRLIAADAYIDNTMPLHKFGVDSLLAVELCNWIGKEFSAEVAVFEILGRATLESVALLVATRSGLVQTKE